MLLWSREITLFRHFLAHFGGTQVASLYTKLSSGKHVTQGNHSYTGNMCAAARAEESRRPDALFKDPVAHLVAGDARSMGDWIMVRLLSNGISLKLSCSFVTPRMHEQVPRTRYGDDLIQELGQHGATQLVLLGAGMDTRAFRLDTLRNFTVFEVDLQETFAVKEPLLAGQPLRCAKRVTIDADLTAKSSSALVKQLYQAGFQKELPAVFLLEGLVMYLDAATTTRVIDSITELAAPGSVVFHDAISASYLTAGIVVHGAPFIGGSDNYADLWGAHFDTTVLDMSLSVRVDRNKRNLIVDRSAIATPARVRGKNVVLFVESRRK